METLKIKVENGKFVDVEGELQEPLSPNKVVGNGWIAKVVEQGKILCEAAQEYDGVKHIIRYKLYPTGISELRLKIGDEPFKLIKKVFAVPKGIKPPFTGELGLSSGKIKDRYVYFREESFSELLEKYKLIGVHHIDPNTTFLIRECHLEKLDVKQELYTDGNLKIVDRHKRQKFLETGDHIDIKEHYKIDDAKYVLIREKDGWGRLYTLEKDLTKLVLPE